MKKVFFALFAVVIAVGGSAFTAAETPVGTVYGSTNGDYTPRTGAYNPNRCLSTSPKVCAYVLTDAGKNILTIKNYTQEQLEDFADLEYVTPVGTGIYN